MATATVAKPKFSVDQLMSATDAARNFSETRRRAKAEPLFITDRNAVDSVLMSYEDFEAMYCALEEYREREVLDAAASRLAAGDAAGGRVSLEEGMGARDYADYLACDPDSISDDALFA